MENKLNIEFSDLPSEVYERIFSFLPNRDLRNIWQIVCTGKKQSEGERTYENAQIRAFVRERLAKRKLILLPFDLKDYPNPENLEYGTRLVETARAVHKYLCSGWNSASRNEAIKDDKRLLELFPLDTFAGYEERALALVDASLNGRADLILEELKKDGIWVNATRSDGWIALLGAASEGHTETVKVLLQNNADISAFNSFGTTALMLAARNGHVKTAQLLIDHETDVNATDKNGCTPLTYAVSDGHVKTAQLLLDYKADVNAANKDDYTPLVYAVSKGYVEIAQLLLDYKANVNATDKNDYTPLAHAVSKGYVEIAKLLLDHGANVNASEKTGTTALMVAAWKGHTETVIVLLQHNADINASDKTGRTALMCAVSAQHSETVTILLEKGANLYARDRFLRSAFDYSSGPDSQVITTMLTQEWSFLLAARSDCQQPHFLLSAVIGMGTYQLWAHRAKIQQLLVRTS